MHDKILNTLSDIVELFAYVGLFAWIVIFIFMWIL